MIISLHYPKTAGTSFRDTLKGVYRDRLYIHHTHKSLMNKDFYLDNGIEVVHGHLLLSDYLKLFPDAKIITWMRDPAARALSYYNYCKYKRENPFSKNFGNRYKTFDAFMNSKRIDLVANDYNLYIGDYKLNDFYFIGIVENYNRDLKILSRLLNWGKYKTLNTNKSPNREGVILSENHKKIILDKFNKEYELYNLAKASNYT